jgi:hypothetical protein
MSIDVVHSARAGRPRWPTTGRRRCGNCRFQREILRGQIASAHLAKFDQVGGEEKPAAQIM